jgi:radical SAM superfamily enzyme YgiQ (UPF0313 family)
MRKHGYNDIKIIDLDLLTWDFETFCHKVKEYSPDLVGIQCMTTHLYSTFRMCRFLRENMKNTKIVLGGSHFNSNPDDVFEHFDIDFVVRGEGEKTFLELVESINDPTHYKNIKGLIFRDSDGSIVINECREYNHELDDLPFPDYDDLYEGHPFYGPPYSRTGRMVTMMTSRGCPFRCSFCDVHNVHGAHVRSRSVDNVIDEIRYLEKKHGIREILFKDSNFHMSKKWVAEFADKVVGQNLNISFFANYRAEVIRDEIVEPLKQAGCSLLFCGIESTEPAVQNVLGKNTSLKQMMSADESIKKYGIKRMYSFMFGSPGDTEKSLQSYIDFTLETNPFLIAINPTIAFPGTALYDYAIKHNLLKNPKWYYSFLLPHNDDLYPGRMIIKGLPPETVNKYIRKAFMKFYLRPSKIYEYVKYLKLKRFISDAALKFFDVVKKSMSYTSSFK